MSEQQDNAHADGWETAGRKRGSRSKTRAGGSGGSGGTTSGSTAVGSYRDRQPDITGRHFKRDYSSSSSTSSGFTVGHVSRTNHTGHTGQTSHSNNRRGYKRGQGNTSHTRGEGRRHAYCGFEYCYVQHAMNFHQSGGLVQTEMQVSECDPTTCDLMQSLLIQVENIGNTVDEYCDYHLRHFRHSSARCRVEGCAQIIPYFKYQYNKCMCETHYIEHYRGGIGYDGAAENTPVRSSQSGEVLTGASRDSVNASSSASRDSSSNASRDSSSSASSHNDEGHDIHPPVSIVLKYNRVEQFTTAWGDVDDPDEDFYSKPLAW